MTLKRVPSTPSAWASASTVSDAATETSSSSRGSSSRGSLLGSERSGASGAGVEVPASTLEGWMYWKRERECWLKVYVVLRGELLFLTRNERSPRPLIQIAVTWVTMSSIGGFCVEGPSGEKMELYLYEQDSAWLWYNSLVEAAGLTKQLGETLAAADDGDAQLPRGLRRSASLLYTGTLVEYQAESGGASGSVSGRHKVWKSVLSAARLRHSWKKRVERIIDRIDK